MTSRFDGLAAFNPCLTIVTIGTGFMPIGGAGGFNLFKIFGIYMVVRVDIAVFLMANLTNSLPDASCCTAGMGMRNNIRYCTALMRTFINCTAVILNRTIIPGMFGIGTGFAGSCNMTTTGINGITGIIFVCRAILRIINRIRIINDFANMDIGIYGLFVALFCMGTVCASPEFITVLLAIGNNCFLQCHLMRSQFEFMTRCNHCSTAGMHEIAAVTGFGAGRIFLIDNLCFRRNMIRRIFFFYFACFNGRLTSGAVQITAIALFQTSWRFYINQGSRLVNSGIDVSSHHGRCIAAGTLICGGRVGDTVTCGTGNINRIIMP